MYAPASPDDLFMRPDEGDGLIEITCSPMRAGPDPASYVADWESSRVGPRHLLLKKRAGRMVHLDGDLAYEGVYEGDGVLAKVLFVRISDRMCGFLGYFLRDDFDRGGVTLNRLVERFARRQTTAASVPSCPKTPALHRSRGTARRFSAANGTGTISALGNVMRAPDRRS